LRTLKGKIDLTIAIGDIVPILGALIARAPFIFVGVNKSGYYKTFGYNYTPWEISLLKKYAQKVYVRDKKTLETLPFAEYVGNPLLDCVEQMSNVKCQMSNEGKIIIGLLPGTRDDAELNMADFEQVIEELISQKELSDPGIQFITATTLPTIPEYVENKPFPQLLAEADLILGLSGTGNEQAAGAGIPVVSFYGRGSQYNKKFAEAQKELLGEALLLCQNREPRTIAAAIWRLIRNPAKRTEMGKIGQERMGETGAIEKIASMING
jgi:hypothetical protein